MEGFANSLQWMRRLRRNSKRCRLALSVVVEALRMPRARFRTLILLDSCQGSLAARRVRRSELACKGRNTRINAKKTLRFWPPPSVHNSVPSTQHRAVMSQLPLREMPTCRNTFSLDIRLRPQEPASAVTKSLFCFSPSTSLPLSIFSLNRHGDGPLTANDKHPLHAIQTPLKQVKIRRSYF